jgi:hypothetical protein
MVKTLQCPEIPSRYSCRSFSLKLKKKTFQQCNIRRPPFSSRKRGRKEKRKERRNIMKLKVTIMITNNTTYNIIN